MSTCKTFPVRIAAVSALFPLFLLAGCKPKPRPAVPPVPVRVAEVSVQDLPVTREAVGIVTPLHSVAILSQVQGILTDVHFRDGADVKSGDLLVTLDRRPFEAALQAAQAQLAQARANEEKAASDFARNADLYKQKTISDSEFSQFRAVDEAAKAAVAVQEAAVAVAKLSLDYTEIRAPIDGRTSRLSVREGSLVRADDSTQPLLTINQLAPIDVNFSLPESDLESLQKAMKSGDVAVLAHLQLPGSEPVEGRLDYIDNTVGLNTGTIALRATFENKDIKFWPGQFVDVTVKLAEETGVTTVPVTAIVAGQSGDQVFIVKADNTIEVRQVHTSVIYHGATAIDGVKPGENVVTEGQLQLLPGSKVSVVKDRGAPAAPSAPEPTGK